MENENVNDKSKIVKLMISVIILIVIALVGTYALTIWRSTENTELTLRIGDISGFYCTKGDNIEINNIGPIFDYTIDGESTTFNVDNQTNEVTKVTVKFNITTITDNLKEESFKYVLMTNTDNSSYTVYTEGNFKDVTNGSNITLLDNYEVGLSSKISFKLVIYIDGNMENPITMQGGSLVGYLDACKVEEEEDTNIYYLKGETDYGPTTFLGTTITRTSIESLEFVKTKDVPSDAGTPVDVSKDSDNSVLLYSKLNSTTNKYKVYIATNSGKVSLTSGYCLFYNLTSVTNIDLSNISTDNVTDMSSMFYSMTSLTSIDLSSFNTSNVNAMSGVFMGVTSLISLDLSSFDTSNVQGMNYMFCGMESLTALNLSSFDTSSVENMNSMFSGALSLTTLDLSSFDTSNVTDMYGMFNAMESLTTIYVTESFTTNSIEDFMEMFTECYNLVGGNGTTYNSNYTDKTYARIDTPSTPGYFTLKS